MIYSMTAFGSARAETEHGTLNIELRTVNSRFLDINIRLPDELRVLEGQVREQIGRYVHRGKIDVRLGYSRNDEQLAQNLDTAQLAHLAGLLATAREYIPDVAAPRLHELLQGTSEQQDKTLDADVWTAMCLQAGEQALEQLQSARRREGQRLAQMMLAAADEMSAIVDSAEQRLPQLVQAHHEKITARLREVLEAASPQGFSQISGAELSARIAQEASLFSLRNDIAEELARLRSHLTELQHLLSERSDAKKARAARGKGWTSCARK